MSIEPRLHRTVAAQPYPLLFATISPDKRHRGKLSASLRVSVPVKPGAAPHPALSLTEAKRVSGAHVLPLEKVVRRCRGCGKLHGSSKAHAREDQRFAGAPGQPLGGKADEVRPRGAGGASGGRWTPHRSHCQMETHIYVRLSSRNGRIQGSVPVAAFDNSVSHAIE